MGIVDSIKSLKSELTLIDDRIRTEISIQRRRFDWDSLIALAYYAFFAMLCLCSHPALCTINYFVARGFNLPNIYRESRLRQKHVNRLISVKLYF